MRMDSIQSPAWPDDVIKGSRRSRCSPERSNATWENFSVQVSFDSPFAEENEQLSLRHGEDSVSFLWKHLAPATPSPGASRTASAAVSCSSFTSGCKSASEQELGLTLIPPAARGMAYGELYDNPVYDTEEDYGLLAPDLPSHCPFLERGASANINLQCDEAVNTEALKLPGPHTEKTCFLESKSPVGHAQPASGASVVPPQVTPHRRQNQHHVKRKPVIRRAFFLVAGVAASIILAVGSAAAGHRHHQVRTATSPPPKATTYTAAFRKPGSPTGKLAAFANRNPHDVNDALLLGYH